MKKRLLLILVAFTIVIVYPGYANWGGGGEGNIGTGNFNALGTEQIEMVNELLDIELYQDRARVSIEYLLHNIENDVTVKAGFPSLVGRLDQDLENAVEYEVDEFKDYQEDDIKDLLSDEEIEENLDSKIVKNLEIVNYKITVNGSDLKYYFIQGGNVEWAKFPDDRDVGSPEPLICWLVSQVKFKKGESKTIKISYDSLYQRGFGGISSNTDYGTQCFFYFLSTGATWKGPIKSGTVNIKTMAVNPDKISILPEKRFKRKGNVFTWSFTNLKPTLKDNIVVSLNNGFSEKAMFFENGKIDYYIIDTDQKNYYDFNSYSAKASSILQGSPSYSAQNVVDENMSTAWVEGAKGSGVGEYLILTLNKPTKVHKIGIVPGYAKSSAIYIANNRVAELKIIINDSYSVTRGLYNDCVSDPRTYQWIDLGNFNADVKNIKLIINKIYKGTKYDDTCISEILLRKRLDKLPPHHTAR